MVNLDELHISLIFSGCTEVLSGIGLRQGMGIFLIYRLLMVFNSVIQV